MSTGKRTGASVPFAASVPASPAPVEKLNSAFSITTKLIKFLLLRGLATDALFLEELNEGQAHECKTLLKRLKEDSLEHSQELLEHTKHVQVVAQLLLEFLKDLPEPLLTYANYDSFIMSMYIKEKAHRTKYCATLLNTTPPHHVALTTQLLTLLHRLVANRAINGLSSELLAPLFAPHFLRPKKITPYMKEDERAILVVMASLIDEYDLLFSGDGGSISSGSTKIRKLSDSPYVTDLSQSHIGSGKLHGSLANISPSLSSRPPLNPSLLEVSKGHKRSASSTSNKSFAMAMNASSDSRTDKDDDLTADDFSDEEFTPRHLNASNDVNSLPTSDS
jgi:hypothetical protein